MSIIIAQNLWQKPLITLPDWPCGLIYRLWDNIQTKELSHQRWWGDSCSHYKWNNFLMHPEIRHGDWYWIDICKVRFPTLFRYIKGITSKIDLFQFLCMASRSSPIQMCIRLYEVRSLNHNGIMFILPIRIVFLRLRPVFRVVVYSVSHCYHSHALRNTNSIYLNVFISFSVKPVIITLTITSLLLFGVLPFLCLLTVDFDWKWHLSVTITF